MPQGAVMSEGSSGESISHFASIRLRVVGNASLQMAVFSLDDVRSKTLVPFALKSADRIVPTRIVNFIETRASFEFKTTNINEVFRINRIVVFSKPVFTSFPGS